MDEPAVSICARTQTRSDACACGTCARRQSPIDKHRANKRDVLALLDLIAGCVDCHPSQPHGDATWGHVGDMAETVRGLRAVSDRMFGELVSLPTAWMKEVRHQYLVQIIAGASPDLHSVYGSQSSCSSVEPCQGSKQAFNTTS